MGRLKNLYIVIRGEGYFIANLAVLTFKYLKNLYIVIRGEGCFILNLLGLILDVALSIASSIAGFIVSLFLFVLWLICLTIEYEPPTKWPIFFEEHKDKSLDASTEKWVGATINPKGTVQWPPKETDKET